MTRFSASDPSQSRSIFLRWRGALRGVAVMMAIMLVNVAAPGVAQDRDRYAALVIDAVSGEVFHARYADEERHPASLTKVMTLFMLFDALEADEINLGDRITISHRADRQPASHLNLPAGASIRVEDAIYALITRSANDIAVAVGEALSGTEQAFARDMTATARSLGMTRTVFRNASGLHHSAQVTTARDMARLAQAIIRHFPQYYHYFATERWSYNGQSHRNHNHLLDSYDGMDGLKTGYIRASGFNLMASAIRGELRVITVVMGGDNARWRNTRVANLTDQAFGSGRGQFLIANGSVPFLPPLPPRAPGAPVVMVADLSVPMIDRAGRRLGFVPLPPLPPIDLRPDVRMSSLLAEVQTRSDQPVGAPLPPDDPRVGAIAAVPPALNIGADASNGEQALATQDFEQGDGMGPTDAPADEGPGWPALADRSGAPPPATDTRPDAVQVAALPTDSSPSTPRRSQPSAAPLPGDSWGIQVGAFSSASDSTLALGRARAQAPELLSDAAIQVEGVDTRRGILYRARLFGLDEQSASMACLRLMSAGTACIPIAPDGMF